MCICIRPSVDGLYRDGTVHISREMHKQCFITRREMTSRAPKPHRHRRGEGGVGFLVRECVAEEVEFIRVRRVFG